MKTFEIEITETLQKVVEVKTNSQEEAYKLVRDKYRNEEIVLDESDYKETDIVPFLYSKKYKEIYKNEDFLNFIINESNEMFIYLSVEEHIKLAFGDVENAVASFEREIA